MGYYTNYTIRTGGDVPSFQVIWDKVEEVSGYSNEVPGDDDSSITFNGKWYDHNRAMKRVSAAFPGVTLVLRGLGEGTNEDWDEWIKTYLDGKLVKLERMVVEYHLEDAGEDGIEAYERWEKRNV